jgi:dephospho-CoA kinase
MFVIGLTGNIATGKSTVMAMLARLGAFIIDADKLAHHLMRAGTPLQQHIVVRFGAGVLAPSGEIDRARLGAVVFADAQALRDLEAIVHPAVVTETLALLRAVTEPIAVVEAIKLLEAGMARHCQAVWVVTTSRAQQVERLVRTRHLSPAEAELRIAAQAPATAQVARADVVIDNGGALADTWAQVVRAWNAIPGAPRVTPEVRWADESRVAEGGR